MTYRWFARSRDSIRFHPTPMDDIYVRLADVPDELEALWETYDKVSWYVGIDEGRDELLNELRRRIEVRAASTQPVRDPRAPIR